MKTAAVICELNPLHIGHRRLFSYCRERGAELVIALMSGDFVQRGIPAVADRHTRAEMALLAGADLVLSYPVRYATGSAERFAEFAVRILDGVGEGFGGIDELVFGSECGELSRIRSLAEVLAGEPDWYRERLRASLREGSSFPKARAAALDDYGELLQSPNNILGVEYVKAILKHASSMKPVTLKREGAQHRDEEASSTAIRSKLLQGMTEPAVLGEIPETAREARMASLARRGPVGAGILLPLLAERLWASDEAETLTACLDVTRDLAGTFLKNRGRLKDWESFAALCSSKSMTASHVSRACLHLALGLGKRDMAEGALLTQLLGIRREARVWLGRLQRGSVPLVVRPSAPPGNMTEAQTALYREEQRVANLYEALASLRAAGPAVHACSKAFVTL